MLQVDENDRPIHPPVIKEVEVLWNPFEDIVPRSTREQREAEAAAQKCTAPFLFWRTPCCPFRMATVQAGLALAVHFEKQMLLQHVWALSLSA